MSGEHWGKSCSSATILERMLNSSTASYMFVCKRIGSSERKKKHPFFPSSYKRHQTETWLLIGATSGSDSAMQQSRKRLMLLENLLWIRAGGAAP